MESSDPDISRSVPSEWFNLNKNEELLVITPLGEWTLHNADHINSTLKTISSEKSRLFRAVLDGRELKGLDSVGCMFLLDLISSAAPKSLNGGESFSLRNFDPSQEAMIKLVSGKISSQERAEDKAELSPLQQLGKYTLEFTDALQELLRFLGGTAVNVTSAVFRPAQFRVREFFSQLESACVSAIPIASLVTFLIGIVVAYLLAMQIEKFGANIFIVDGIAMAMCRELSPMIVAIIVAGRSGSAYTAQIGAMKINEEIDALFTLGLSPFRVLVIPRVLALMLSMPLLVFVGDVAGIFGGYLIADGYLGVEPATFIDRLQVVLPLKALVVGLVKAPVFAIFIALIGCRMGFNVENNARSLGLNTTSTVVQSVVAVILLNAAFAVIFAELGI
ncbi:MAG: peptidylprolyl isomerase [Proteobacteria bacterium]|nr:MAG: peptidylprolyl isomerase [Pseudomonadota bacterium]